MEFQRALERAISGEGSGGARKLTRRRIRLELYYKRSRNQLGLQTDSGVSERIVLDQCTITDDAALDFPDCNPKLNVRVLRTIKLYSINFRCSAEVLVFLESTLTIFAFLTFFLLSP